MKVKFLTSSNKNFEPLFGLDIDIIIDMVVYMKFSAENLPFDFRDGNARTSKINKIKYNEVSRNYYEIIVTTNNSNYIFAKGEKSEKKPLTEDEKLALAMNMIY